MTKNRLADIWVGVDVGTQGVRVVAVDAEGGLAASGSAPLQSTRVGVRHTQDPAHWWDAVALACSKCVSNIDRDRIRGIALAATSGTVLLVDAEGAPLSAGLMYDDLRAARYLPRINDVGQRVWERSGYRRMKASWALPKIMWLLNNTDSDSVNVAHQSDFLNRRLVGHNVATDFSSGLKSGVDLITKQWPDDVLDQLGLDPTIFPKLVRSGSVLGKISAQAARATGLPQHTPVFASMTDGCAAQLGAGVVTVGNWNSVLGTTLVLKGVSETLLDDPTGAVYSHISPTGQWLPGGASNTGAGYLTQTFPTTDMETLNTKAHSVDEVALGTVTFPLNSRGERFPFVAPDAHSFTMGGPVSNDLSEVEQFVAALMGLAAIERLAFEHVERLGASTDGRIVLSGGGTRSRFLNQLRANMLGRELSLPAVTQPAVGAAVLAASQELTLVDAASTMVRVGENVEPDRPRENYDELYQSFIDQLRQRGWLEYTTPSTKVRSRK